MINTNLERLQTSNVRIKTNIANAYTKAGEKGATLPLVQNSENLAETIASIEKSDGGWKPLLDWFDIEKILEEDTEEYEAKMIWLITDRDDTLTLNMEWGRNANHTVKIKTSDNAEYISNLKNFSHTWNKEYDKNCELGYKTRYLIIYFNTTELNWYAPTFYGYVLYCICKNMHISTNDWRYMFPYFSIAEAIKLKNCKLTNTAASAGALLTNTFGNVSADRLFLEDTKLSGTISNFKLNGLPTNEQLWKLYNCLEDFKISSANELFSGLRLLVTAPKFQFSDTQVTQNWMSTFRYCYSLKKIMYLDFKTAKDVRYTFDGCGSLEEIVEIYNIEVSRN